MYKKIIIFTNFFFCHSHWFSIFDDLKSEQSCEPPSTEYMESGEFITANQRKTEVTSTVKNYRKSLRSQHLLRFLKVSFIFLDFEKLAIP